MLNYKHRDSLEEKEGKFRSTLFILNFNYNWKHEFLLLARSLPGCAAGGEYPD
jgi:hypothetical protein